MKLLLSPTRIVAALVLLSSIAIALYPLISPAPTAKALALTVFTIGFWATGVIPEYLTALLFFSIAMLFSISPPSVIFAGFESTVFWLVFGGLVFGVAIKQTGLGVRIASRLARKSGESYAGIITSVFTVGLALSFIMPSAVGRVALLLPIASALSDRLGFAKESPGRKGIILGAAFGSLFPAFAILPANVPNLVLAGATEMLYGFTPVYGEYLLLHFPVLGLLKAAMIIGIILLLYPDHPKVPASDDAPQTPLTSGERGLALLLAVTIGFWITDFLHHISPAWIALSAGVICLLPMVGLVPVKAFKEEVNYGTLFFLAGIIGFGTMLSHSGLGNQLAKALLKILPLEPGSTILNLISLTFTAVVLGIATTAPGVPAVLTPLANDMANAAALPVQTVLMTQVLGFSMVLFTYQAPPLVMAVQLGGLKSISVTKFCLILTLATILFLLPVNFLWWRFLGWI
jgi:anion transporter